MELSNIVPWGRSLEEYSLMFTLDDSDLKRSILGCGDGPASFNAELTEMGGDIVSVDPVYQFSSEQLQQRIDEVYPQIIDQLSKNKSDYLWTHIPNVEALGSVRMKAMEYFLRDFEECGVGQRYINAALPKLPFENNQFELALCSHFLFLYSEHVSEEQHIAGVKELCRVAKEVRIYPLLSISSNQISPHLTACIDALEEMGVKARLTQVDYEFQKGATQMLCLSR